MMDEAIIASAKKIIIRKSKRGAPTEIDYQSDCRAETSEQINFLLGVIKQQDDHLRKLEQKLDMLLSR